MKQYYYKLLKLYLIQNKNGSQWPTCMKGLHFKALASSVDLVEEVSDYHSYFELSIQVKCIFLLVKLYLNECIN